MNSRVSLRYVMVGICLLCTMAASAVTSHKRALLLHPTRAQVDSVLCVLDDAISRKADYRDRRMARADSLVKAAAGKHGKKCIDALKAAYDNCSHVNGKKSMEILNRMAALPEYKTDKNLQLWVRDSKGYIYAVTGMYHRSYEILHDVNVHDYDHRARMHHYEAVRNVLGWVGTAFDIEGALSPEEKEMQHIYSDSLLNSNRDAISMVFADVDHDLYEKAYDKAIERLVALYPKTTEQNETYVYAVLSDVFTAKKDSLGEIYYLTETSINDIKAGTTEYMCLPILAKTIFQEGEVDRAYNYLKCCIDDAHAFPSQFLINQATVMFPMIDQAYQLKKADYEKSQRNVFFMWFGASFLFFIIVSLLIFLRNRQQLMGKLKRANDAKDIFLKNMNHEVHSPLNVVYGFAQIMANKSIPLDEDTTREMAGAICQGAEQLTKILDNVVEVTDKLSKLDKLEDVASIIEQK